MKKEDVISHFGGTGETAKALGITHPSVSGWGEIIPQLRAYQIEKATNGKLKYDPDLYRQDTKTS